ncbi:hypothetical protein CEXT_253951 [Caerostris extrusa]|uniref:Uncharacterized protein n=1 Tax=Caerostris extrusa TaxID=172846 RepID=A0AAV4XAR9_CAEEX|nr:hypothetical protein CEXT_253951 [Caerostris extrusa]
MCRIKDVVDLSYQRFDVRASLKDRSAKTSVASALKLSSFEQKTWCVIFHVSNVPFGWFKEIRKSKAFLMSSGASLKDRSAEMSLASALELSSFKQKTWCVIFHVFRKSLSDGLRKFGKQRLSDEFRFLMTSLGISGYLSRIDQPNRPSHLFLN